MRGQFVLQGEGCGGAHARAAAWQTGDGEFILLPSFMGHYYRVWTYITLDSTPFIGDGEFILLPSFRRLWDSSYLHRSSSRRRRRRRRRSIKLHCFILHCRQSLLPHRQEFRLIANRGVSEPCRARGGSSELA